MLYLEKPHFMLEIDGNEGVHGRDQLIREPVGDGSRNMGYLAESQKKLGTEIKVSMR